MPRPRELRRSKLRDRSADDDTDVNRCGGWSREKLIKMNARFAEAMRRAMTARVPHLAASSHRGSDEQMFGTKRQLAPPEISAEWHARATLQGHEQRPGTRAPCPSGRTHRYGEGPDCSAAATHQGVGKGGA